MMNKKRSKNMEKVKYALFFPLFAFLMLISNIEAVARIGSEITAEVFRMQPKSDQEVPKKVYQGIVSDEAGNPLANVSVIIQNTNDGTVTDSEGKFKIKASPSQSLWFSYVGKAAMTYPLEKAKENMIHIQLKTETTDYNAIKQTAKPVNIDNAVFQVVEKMPEYPGGMKECINFLTSHINYPAQAKKEGLQGRVIVQFVVTKSGAITNPTIVRGVSPELDAEALRVVKMMPDWTPGTQRGIPVNVNYTIPIVFRLPSK